MFFPPTPPLLKGEQVESTMQKPAVVGQLRLDLIGEIAATPELVKIERLRVSAEVGSEDLVKSSVFLGGIVSHVMRLPAGTNKCWVGVHSGTAPARRMDFKVEMGRSAGGIAGTAVVSDDVPSLDPLTAGDVESREVGVVKGGPVVGREPYGHATQATVADRYRS